MLINEFSSDEMYFYAHVRDALIAWQVEAKKENPNEDCREWGLCNWIGYYWLDEEIGNCFFKETVYPFDGNINKYSSDSNKHLNPKRIAWVDAKVIELTNMLIQEPK